MNVWPRLAALALMLAGIGRMAATYEVFSPTFDETFHLACGLQWWETHEYTVEPQHPPLSRIVAAAGPYLAGGRRTVMLDPAYQGWSALEQIGVKRGLALARAGNLVFFVLLCGIVWWWTRRLGGEWAAALALFLLICLPPVLGHGALATTDLALTATLPLALYATASWWRRRTLASAALAGLALALMLGSKYSALLFFPASLAGLLLVEWRRGLRPARSLSQWVLAGITVVCVLFAVFHFRAPWTQIAAGIKQVAEHSAGGHDAYLLGEYRTTGWWYFFPVVFALKTPLAFLALLFLVRGNAAGPAAAAAGLMLCVLPSTINIGIRHILPVYPLLVIPVAAGSWRWIEARGWRAAAVVVSLAALFAASIQAAPDYLADFNLLARPPLERVRVDSDLDWGQDVFRLADGCRERNIGAISVASLGITDLEMAGLPYARVVKPHEPTSGWFAIGVTERVIRNAMNQGYRWLDGYQPVERIGKTIDLFYIRNPEWPDRSAGFDHPTNYGEADFPSATPVGHIAEPLRADLLAGDMRTRSVHGFEGDAAHGFCWLASGRPGFRVTLWARRAMKTTLRVEAAAGPMRFDNVRHLQATVNGAPGEEFRFEGKEKLSWPADLQPGVNVIQIQTPDAPQRRRLESGEVRELIVRIDRIDIEPREP